MARVASPVSAYESRAAQAHPRLIERWIECQGLVEFADGFPCFSPVEQRLATLETEDVELGLGSLKGREDLIRFGIPLLRPQVACTKHLVEHLDLVLRVGANDAGIAVGSGRLIAQVTQRPQLFQRPGADRVGLRR